MNTRIFISEEQATLIDYVQSLFNKPVYLVGGAVRDILLDINPKDYDFSSALTTSEVREQLKGKHRVHLVGEKYGTVGFNVGEEMIEITTFRTEEYTKDSRKPTVKFVDSVTEDLSRRDFTINAMAIRCDSYKLIDPFDGLANLAERILKAVGVPKVRFKEDPLRILRGIRISSKYGLKIEAVTADRMSRVAYRLLEVSKERWVMEMDKILLMDGDNLESGLNMLWSLGIFKYIIPELHLQLDYAQNSMYHNFELHQHTINVVRATPPKLDLRWAALLHDVAKPFTRTENKNGTSNYINHDIVGAEMADKISRYLKFSNRRREYIVDIIKNHLNDDCELREYDNKGKIKYSCSVNGGFCPHKTTNMGCISPYVCENKRSQFVRRPLSVQGGESIMFEASQKIRINKPNNNNRSL